MEFITKYTGTEEQLVIQSALHKKQIKLIEDRLTQFHFSIRSKSIQEYFQRLSCFNKTKCILNFVASLRLPVNIFQILRSFCLSHFKMEAYSMVDPKTDNTYHKLIWDHDRMLDKDVLMETMASDLVWFDSIDDDNQCKLITSLIELCSGSIRRTLYMPLHKTYSCTIDKCMKSQYTGRMSTETLADIDIYMDPLEDDPEFDSKHPSSVEVCKQRRRWFDLIEKYKLEVTPQSDEDVTLKNIRDRKKLNSKDKLKRGKKKVSESEFNCEIDLIQLLPIWIVKKIFSFFSDEELLILKKVNGYWAYVCFDIINERKTREKINELLKQMRANINPKFLEDREIPTSSRMILESKPKTSSKNLSPHYEFVAVHKSVLPKKLKKLRSVSLETQAKADRRLEYNIETGDMIPFPRLIKKGMELWKYRPCALQDVGVNFDVDIDIEKQKSFLTYSLDSFDNSIMFTADENDISDW